MADVKRFFDVFPGYECTKDIKDILDHVYVKEAVLVKSEKTLKVHIESKILISKEDIYSIEAGLTTFIFQNKMQVKIIEHYDLSNQYNVQTLTDVYKDSLLFELIVESAVLYRLVKDANWYIDSNIITLTLVDNFLAKTRSADIKNYLETVYRERFGIEIQVGFSYTEEQKNAIRKANEHKLKLEISQIMEQQIPENDARIANEESDNQNDKNANQTDKKGNSSDKKNGIKKPESKSKENNWSRSSFGRNKVNDPEVM